MMYFSVNSAQTIVERLYSRLNYPFNYNFTIEILSNSNVSYTKDVVDVSNKHEFFSVFELTIQNVSGTTGLTDIYCPDSGEMTLNIYENPTFSEILSDLNKVFSTKIKIEKIYQERVMHTLNKKYKINNEFNSI